MDYIKELCYWRSAGANKIVSILVVMDYIKERFVDSNTQRTKISFNPCCDGLYKRTGRFYSIREPGILVSILVVMDYIKERISSDSVDYGSK